MIREKAFDLYDFVLHLTSEQEWIQKVQIFGSRRYLSNISYGSDIDLLISSAETTSTDRLRNAIHDPYVDAFLVFGGVATSVSNRSQVVIENDASNLDAVTIWERTRGWVAGEDYRILTTLSDQSPAMSDFSAGARPIVIFCALATEFKSVVARFSGGKTERHWSLGSFYRVHVPTTNGNRLVVVVRTGVASVKAAISATRILSYFHRPEIAILVGITAGLKNEGLNLGDVIVPTATVDVESGKKTPKGKEPAGMKLEMDARAHAAVSTWAGLSEWQSAWKTEISGRPTLPLLHTDCKLACTASVIAFEKEAASYKALDRKVRGIEMEAVGIAQACVQSAPLLVIKAISDWADSEKDDRWHSYCMQVAADLTYRLISDETI